MTMVQNIDTDNAQQIADTLGGSSPFTLVIDTVDPLTNRRISKPLVTTRAVETKAGWRGQVLVGSMIVVESEKPFTDIDADEPAQFAVQWANTYVMTKIMDLLCGQATP